MSVINVLFATDKNYIAHTAAAIKSLILNNSESSFHIHYIIDEISPKDKLRLDNLLVNSKSKIEIHIIDKCRFSSAKVNYHFKSSVYYRVFLDKLLVGEKVLYLDSDLIVVDDIKGLYNLDLSDFYLAGVEDIGFNRHQSIKMSPISKYFNAGVLLINVQKWRDNNLSDKCLSEILRPSFPLECADQDMLNHFIDGNWIKVGYENNQLAIFHNIDFFSIYPHLEEFVKFSLSNPRIIHYSGSSKPWQIRNTHPRRADYWHYLKLTDFYSVKFLFIRSFQNFYNFYINLSCRLKKIISNICNLQFYL